MVNGVSVRGERTHAGSWLPIHDAARKLGILEILAYRLMSEGKLQSRRQDDGMIEIWVADTDPPMHEPAQPSDVGRDERYIVLAERLASSVHYQVEVLTGSLAAAYDRNSQLARENGALTERLEGVERELKALRDIQDRLHAVEATNEQLTRLMSTWIESQAHTKRWSWSWLPGAGIVLLLLLLLVPLVVFSLPIIAVSAAFAR